jgi:outer membrane receptor protein involved in Fe transport
MFNKKILAKSVRHAIAIGAVGTSMLTIQNLQAQEATAESDSSVEKISITGSRIKRPNLVSSSPVTEITAADIAVSGITRIEDLLNDMPQIFGGQTSGTANGSTGTATVDLRNLGPTRTLTLINGRRMPAGSPVAGGIGGDVNQIPAALVERVEVLTGGASATYGSDAVAGVVNFIMKDDFEGFQFDFQHSFYQHDNNNDLLQGVVTDAGYDVANGTTTDGHANDFSFLLGANTADGRGNVTAYASYRNIQALTQDSRDYSGCALGGDAATGWACRGSTTLPETRVTDFGTLGDTGFDFKVAGNEFVPRDGTTYNYGPLNHFQRPDKRQTFGALGHYDLNDHATVFAEVNFMDNRSLSQIAPSGAFFITTSLTCGNPLLSDQQFEATCGANGLTRDDILPGVYIGRRNVEGNPRIDDIRHSSWRGVLGVRGNIDDNWSYEVFGNYGTVSYTEVYTNELSITNIGRALDAVDDGNGNAVCRTAVAGPNGEAPVDPACVPWNVFETGAVTQAQLAYITRPLFAKGETVMTQVSGYVTGDLTDYGIMIPGTSRGLSVVAGVERRTEKLVYQPDAGYTSGDGAGQGGPTGAVAGSYSVEEIFGEVSIPLLEDMAIADELYLELAYRYSDYSTDNTTDTYKYALDWLATEDMRFRASYQRAVRAANVRELFRPQTLGLFNMNAEPCSTAAGANRLTAEECARTGVSAAVYAAGGPPDNPAGQFNQITGGNANLEPEVSDTVSFGVILTPSFLDGFTLALDYFDIEVEKAIGQVPAGELLTACAKGNDAACTNINRGATTESLWLGTDSITATDVNLGSVKTAGLDFDASYKFGLDDMGDLKMSLVGTWIDTYEQQSSSDGIAYECAGKWDRNICGAYTQGPTPELRYNLRASWETPWDAVVTSTIRFIDETDEMDNNDGSVLVGGTKLKSVYYLDMAANYQVLENTNISLGINNILDKEPQVVGNAPSGSANGNTWPGPYDILGRYVFMGATVTF